VGGLGIGKGDDSCLGLEAFDFLLRLGQAGPDLVSLLGKEIVQHADALVNRDVLVEVGLQQGVEDLPGDHRIGVPVPDEDDVAAPRDVHGESAPDLGGGADAILAASEAGQDVARPHGVGHLKGQVQTGQDLDLGIDDVLATAVRGLDVRIVGLGQGRSVFEDVADQDLGLGDVGGRIPEIDECGGAEAEQETEEDLPLVAEEHVHQVGRVQPCGRAGVRGPCLNWNRVAHRFLVFLRVSLMLFLSVNPCEGKAPAPPNAAMAGGACERSACGVLRCDLSSEGPGR